VRAAFCVVFSSSLCAQKVTPRRGVAQATNVVVTLGSEGLLVHASMEGEYRTDRLPAFNTAPKDVVGAGDSLFTCASLALCAGDAWQGVYLGALAAGCQVSRVRKIPLNAMEIYRRDRPRGL